MKKIAIAMMIFAVATAHGAYREGAKRIADGHDSYEIIQYRNSNGMRPDGLLWFGPSVPRAYEEVISTYTNELDEVETVTNQVPVDHSLCKWTDGASAPTARSEAEIAAYDAYVAAQAAAALDAIATQDAASYASELVDIGTVAVVFTNVSPGMTYLEIAEAMETSMQAAAAGGDIATYMTMDMVKDKAKASYERVLEPAGIVLDRLWRALAKLQE
jgi:hypothetical protein